MAVTKGWQYTPGKDTRPVILATDVTESNVLTITVDTTTPVTVGICGAAGVPYGVTPKTVDISEDGAQQTAVRDGIVVCIAAAAVTDLTIPLTTAASGQVTPCTVNNQIVLGKPLNLAALGEQVSVDLSTMGTYYGA